ncbi:hypothetical protein DDE18_14910 [Nocardioides gansuensis]|uniref:Diaminopimelate decarboxylase n=1 Tax=Nocardioides gansuensis TaxID=2138300 RepID=A0A2T8F8D9_9ACTN|nr:alanine racemase [Nocardioides gansuensis]PVG81982.1 hypothetical protein DDE18_14910 [Nocardioides gansuensis]
MLSPVTAAGTRCARALDAESLPAVVRDHLLERAGREPISGYVYDASVAASRARMLRAALPPWATLLFAVKSNGHAPVLRALLAEGGVDGLEVASAHEARLAATLLPAGAPLAAAGPAKHPQLLGELLDAGVTVLHAESELELRRISVAAQERGVRAAVALRVNPAEVAVTGTLAMGGRSSAFGIPEPDVPAAIEHALGLPGIDLVGFHMHAVSGNRDARAHAAYVGWVLDWSLETARTRGVDLRWVDAGGGLGVSYDGSPELDLAVLAEELDRLQPPAGVEVVLEPGRWLVNSCGWYAAEVVDIKDSYGQTFVIVRGGIGGYALPGTEDFPFPVAVLPREEWAGPGPRPERRTTAVTVSGELCTPEDVLVRDVVMERVRVGDLLVFPQAGAYGHEFALNAFLGHPVATRHVLAGTPVPGALSSPA